MARINVDDNVEAQDQFWRLLEIVKDRDAALGKLVRFFRIAQKAYGRGEPITQEQLESAGLTVMVESGWAIPADAGYTAFGADTHFEWYRERCESASAGGRARAAGQRNPDGTFKKSTPATIQPAGSSVQPNTSQNQPESSLPAPAPVPSPVLVLKNKERENFQKPHAAQKEGSGSASRDLRSEITKCSEAWRSTLKAHGIDRSITPHDETNIGRLIQQRGAESVLLAFIGARHEPRDSKFNPSDFLSISRVAKPENFERFVNLGSKASLVAASELRKKEKAAESEKEPEGGWVDPEKVRALVGGLFGKVPK